MAVALIIGSNLQMGGAHAATAGDGDTRPAPFDVTGGAKAPLKFELGQWAIAVRKQRDACDAHADAAQKGNAQGVNDLGRCFLSGKGRRRSFIRALELFRVAAQAGNAEGHLNLGRLYRDGLIVATNLETAAHHFLAAARMGSVLAMVEHGLSLPMEPDQRTVACDWFARAAEKNNARALRLFGDCFEFGLGRPRDQNQSFHFHRRAAQAGDVTGMTRTARHLLKRDDTPDSKQTGCSWAEAAARQGDAEGMRLLAMCYRSGIGRHKDLALASHWRLKGVDAARKIAMHNLAAVHGAGVGADPRRATEIVLRALQRGDIVAVETIIAASKNYSLSFRGAFRRMLGDRIGSTSQQLNASGTSPAQPVLQMLKQQLGIAAPDGQR